MPMHRTAPAALSSQNVMRTAWETNMHQHNQTIADLERMQDPSGLEISLYLAIMLAGVACVILFLFSF